MERHKALDACRGIQLIVAALMLLAVLATACAGQPNQSGDLAALQQTVVAQQTQIAGLDEKVSALQRPAAAPPAAPAAAATRAPAPPTATPVPRVTDMPVSGTAKGLESAKVTIAEYSDFQ